MGPARFFQSNESENKHGELTVMCLADFSNRCELPALDLGPAFQSLHDVHLGFAIEFRPDEMQEAGSAVDSAEQSSKVGVGAIRIGHFFGGVDLLVQILSYELCADRIHFFLSVSPSGDTTDSSADDILGTAPKA